MDDGWTAYHKVHQILKANACNPAEAFTKASWKYAKNNPYKSVCYFQLLLLTAPASNKLLSAEAEDDSQVCEAWGEATLGSFYIQIT